MNWKNKPECLNVAITKIYETYDPSALITTDHVFVIDNLFGKLLYVGENNAIYSGIAKSWKISEDKKSYTINLDEKIKFSDGTSITSEDVIYSYKRHLLFPGTHLELKNKILGAEKIKDIDESILGLKKINEKSLMITLNRPDEKFLYWLAFPELVIMPKSESFKKVNHLSLLVTSGAYFVAKKEKDFLLLKSNPYFYTDKGSAGKCFKVWGIENPEEAITRFKNKEIDIMDYGAAFSPNFSFFYNNPDYAVVSGEPRALAYFIFNPRRKEIAISNQRRAISNNIINEELIPYALDQAFSVTKQFLVETHEGFLTPVEIQEALEGYTTSEKIPKEIVILYPEVFGESYKIFLKKKLEQQLGVNISMITYREGEVLFALAKNNWDMFFFLVGMGEKATDILLSYHFKDESPLYPWKDEVISKEMKEINENSDQRKKLNAYKEISKRLIQEAYIKPCFTFRWPILMRSDLEFKKFNQFKFNNDLWYLEWKK